MRAAHSGEKETSLGAATFSGNTKEYAALCTWRGTLPLTCHVQSPFVRVETKQSDVKPRHRGHFSFAYLVPFGYRIAW